MNTQADGRVKEQMMMMLKTDGKTGEQTKIYVYQHSNRFLNWLWHLRHGQNGERISQREAKRFEPQ